MNEITNTNIDECLEFDIFAVVRQLAAQVANYIEEDTPATGYQVSAVRRNR